MMAERPDTVEFDELVARALADTAWGPAPRPVLKSLVLARVAREAAVPAGFMFHFAADEEWLPYPIAGIRMKILTMNESTGYATLLLDVAPGVRFPAHRHGGAEECYVISGSLYTLGRRLGAGDFVHADPGTDHPDLWTEEGARVLLVIPPEDVPVSR